MLKTKEQLTEFYFIIIFFSSDNKYLRYSMTRSNNHFETLYQISISRKRRGTNTVAKAKIRLLLIDLPSELF